MKICSSNCVYGSGALSGGPGLEESYKHHQHRDGNSNQAVAYMRLPQATEKKGTNWVTWGEVGGKQFIQYFLTESVVTNQVLYQNLDF